MGRLFSVVFVTLFSFTGFAQAEYQPKLLLSNTELRSLSKTEQLNYLVLFADTLATMSEERSESVSILSMLWHLTVEPAFCAKKRSSGGGGSCIVCGFVSTYGSNGSCQGRKTYGSLKCEGNTVLCNPAYFGTDGGNGACVERGGDDLTGKANAKFLMACQKPQADAEKKKKCDDLVADTIRFRKDAELEKMDKFMVEGCKSAIAANYGDAAAQKWDERIATRKELDKNFNESNKETTAADLKDEERKAFEAVEQARKDKTFDTPAGIEARKKLLALKEQRLKADTSLTEEYNKCKGITTPRCRAIMQRKVLADAEQKYVEHERKTTIDGKPQQSSWLKWQYSSEAERKSAEAAEAQARKALKVQTEHGFQKHAADLVAKDGIAARASASIPAPVSVSTPKGKGSTKKKPKLDVARTCYKLMNVADNGVKYRGGRAGNMREDAVLPAVK